MTSRRQQIVDEVKERLALITTANEYAPGHNFETDLGLSLSEWRTEAFAEEELPGINLRDESESVTYKDKHSGSVMRQLNVVADLVFKETDVSATLARKGLADVERAVAVDPTWGGRARLTIMRESRLMTDDKGNWLGGARVALTVEYFTRPWEP
ncbi:MAG TPA: hypothetical protein VN256_08120 [Pyrinomonadaceae bacterium]|nr:hypothetical protein [Pyrinomonadaceae bacterium]